MFVSSTFTDMQAEREELMKRVFPRLRKACEQRGVAWCEVDLRWGITDAEKDAGRVLPICLEEIDRSRPYWPYFIGLLGQRYGWVPDDTDPVPIDRLIATDPRFGWLADFRGRSATELEIVYGVLRNPTSLGQAFFYFRDPAAVPKGEDHVYRDVPTADDVRRHGVQEARRRADAMARKLADLKDRIRAAGVPVVDGYASPQDLGQRVYAHLMAVIDRRFPADIPVDPLEHAAAEHEALAKRLARAYVGRPDEFARLDAHAVGDGPPLLVIAEPGAGKSALLSNWAGARAGTGTGTTILTHFAGASGQSADSDAMLRRLADELGRRFDIAADLLGSFESPRERFAFALAEAARAGRVVLVLDAVDELDRQTGLDDVAATPDLGWLPKSLPTNVRLVASARPGPVADELSGRGWPSIHVRPLGPAERTRVLEAYLGQYRKALRPAQVRTIVDAPQAANPLFLRTILEELRLHGSHETLDERIRYYLAAGTPEGLYDLILDRYERDYDSGGREGLVRDTFALLTAARRGLAEAELLDLLGDRAGPLAAARWAPLHSAAAPFLVNRDGLLDFAHESFRAAVRRRYLDGRDGPGRMHERLAVYFAALVGGNDVSPRAAAELPWQMARLGRWTDLARLLTDVPFFSAAWQHDEVDVRAFWAEVEAASDVRLDDEYRRTVHAPGWRGTADYLTWVTRLLFDAGRLQLAAEFGSTLVDAYRQFDNPAGLAGALNEMSRTLQAAGRLDEAVALQAEARGQFKQTGGQAGWLAATTGQASLLLAMGDLFTAAGLYAEAEAVCRQWGDRKNLAIVLKGRANCLHQCEKSREALTLVQEAQGLAKETGQTHVLAAISLDEATFHHAAGDAAAAAACNERAVALFRRLGNKSDLARGLGNRGVLLYELGRLDEALGARREEEQLCRELGDADGLAECLGGQAIILEARGDEARGDGGAAAALRRQVEDLDWRVDRQTVSGLAAAREHGLSDGGVGLARERNRMEQMRREAIELKEAGDLDGALRIHQELQQRHARLGDEAGAAAAMGNAAVVLAMQKQYAEAILLQQRAEATYRKLADRGELRNSLRNSGLMLRLAGDPVAALTALREEEALCRELRQPRDEVECLLNQVAAHAQLGDDRSGVEVAERAAALAAALGDTDRAATAKGYAEFLGQRLASKGRSR